MRDVTVDGEKKQLADCTLTDIDNLAAGAQPASVALGRSSPESMYAWIAQEMRQKGADTVGDLGETAVRRSGSALGLDYADTSDPETLRKLFDPGPGEEPPAHSGSGDQPPE